MGPPGREDEPDLFEIIFSRRIHVQLLQAVIFWCPKCLRSRFQPLKWSLKWVQTRIFQIHKTQMFIHTRSIHVWCIYSYLYQFILNIKHSCRWIWHTLHGSYGIEKLGKWQHSYLKMSLFSLVEHELSRNVKNPWKLWFRGMKRIVKGTWFLSEYIARCWLFLPAVYTPKV